MTMRYSHQVTYRCDGDACIERAIGTDDQLPEGWTVVVEGKGTTHWYGHRCPACSPPQRDAK